MSQHDTPEHGDDSGSQNDTTEETDRSQSAYDTGWSWGAFMFDAPFLIAIRKYAYLLVYLLMLIPLLNFIVYLGLKIYLGIKGRELAQDSETFNSRQERVGFFRAFDWAGKVLFWVMVAVFVLGIILTVATGLGLSALIDGSASVPAGAGS